jgi:hypothetical protein
MPTRKDAAQKATNVEVGGKLIQSSDVPSTEQIVDQAKIKESMQQEIRQQASLGLGRYKATGAIAVLCLAGIALAYLLVKWLMR